MHSLNLDDCAIGLTRHRIGLFRRARNEDDVSCFRRLKQLAIESKDHLLEQDFFRKEQLAARFWETKGIALLPGFLYEWLSDFGRSILRPTVFLACVFLISACAYYWMANPQSRTSEAAIVFSAAQLFGISPWASEAKNFGLALLFGKLEFVPFGVQIIALTESILSVVSLFLIGLGLRNRFRL